MKTNLINSIGSANPFQNFDDHAKTVINRNSRMSKKVIYACISFLALSVVGCSEDDEIDTDAVVIYSAFDVTDPTDSKQVLSYSADETVSPDEWYFSDYNPSTDDFTISVLDESSNGWIIRSADGQTYGRVKVSLLIVELDPESKSIVLSYELWDGSSWETISQSPELSFTTSKAYWDMETNTLSDSSSEWDLAISDVANEYRIEVNGGNFGDGQGGIGILALSE